MSGLEAAVKNGENKGELGLTCKNKSPGIICLFQEKIACWNK
jgi:hypothetical protein